MKIVKRTFFVTEEGDKKLGRLAKKNKVSKSEINRVAIDRLPDDLQLKGEPIVKSKTFKNQNK